MTPSNINNGNPLILRIMDALGVLHQVAPVNHTHTKSEITDLTFDATPTAGSSNPVTSAGIKEGIDNKKDLVDGTGFVKVLNGTPNIYGENGIVLAAGASSEINSLNIDKAKLIRLANLLAANYAPDAIRQIEGASDVKAQIDTYISDGQPYASIGLYIDNGEVFVEKEVIITLNNIDNLIRALEAPEAPALNGNKLITNGQVYTALGGIKTEFIQENANAGYGGSTTFPTSSFAIGKLYVVTILNSEEKYVHQYFDKGSAASETIYIHGNTVVPVGTNFSMLVWKDGDGGLHVDYQGEFEIQSLE